MRIEVTQADVDRAYALHFARGWGLYPEWTPPAVALRREAVHVSVGYDSLSLNGTVALLPSELRAYVRAFAESLLVELSPEDLRAIRDLHKTNSDHAKPVAAPRLEKRVGPATFEVLP